MSQSDKEMATKKPKSHLILGNEAHPHMHRRLPPSLRIVIGLLLLIAVGTGLLMLPWMAAERPLTFMEAIFTATSALTVTGLSVITASTDLSYLGQVTLLLLIQVGGVGYMFAASLAIRLFGRRINLLDRLALANSLGLNKPQAIQQLLRRVLVGILLLEGAGTLSLWVHWNMTAAAPPNRTFFYALFHSVSAFCNAGFDLFSGLPEYPLGIPQDNASLLIMASLIVLGGLGIPVLSELISRQRRTFSLHTRITLWMVVVLILIGWIGIGIPESLPDGILHDAPLSEKLVRSFFHSISTRTAGFVGLPDFGRMQPESSLMSMMLMFIGSAPASMGGGITTGTFAVLMLSLWGYARGYDTAVISGRTLQLMTVRRAGAILTIGISVVCVATWLLLVTHPITLNEALFEVISAFATCGLTLGATAELNIFGRWVIMFVMFWGRLGGLTIIIALAQRMAHHKQLVKFPQEDILIG